MVNSKHRYCTCLLIKTYRPHRIVFYFSRKSFTWIVARNEMNIFVLWNLKPLVTCNNICSLMRDSALALSTFPWTWNLTWKTDCQTNLLQKNDLLNALLLNEKQTDESLCPLIIWFPLSAAKKYSRGKFVLAANCRMKRSHWQLFALSTLSFSVSIENFGFTVSTPFFFFKKMFF